MHLIIPLILFVDPGIKSTDYTCYHKENGKHTGDGNWFPEVCGERHFVRCLGKKDIRVKVMS